MRVPRGSTPAGGFPELVFTHSNPLPGPSHPESVYAALVHAWPDTFAAV